MRPGSSSIALALLLALAESGCFATALRDLADSRPVGSLEVVSAPKGRRTLSPAVCTSGERELFLGADFRDPESDLIARLLVEPTGEAALRIFSGSRPLEEGTLFRRADCSRFGLSLERTGWQVNDVYDLRATLDVDCRSSDGDAVSGRLAVEHCH